jgi:DNA primase
MELVQCPIRDLEVKIFLACYEALIRSIRFFRQTSRNYSIETLKETGLQKKVMRKNIDRYKNKIAFLIHSESGLLSGIL